jgi:hypothetical protein
VSAPPKPINETKGKRVFVRWVVRGHKNADIANVTFHDAYLVESYRDDNGEPRQRTITYLGNVRQIDGEFPAIERGLFLLRTQTILDSIKELSDADREQTMEQIQKRIEPLTDDEVMIGFLNTLRWYYRWWESHDTVPSDEDVMKMLKGAKQTSESITLDKWE